VYHFPRLYAVDFRPLKEALDRNHGAEWENYDPSAAIAKEAEEREQNQKLSELRQSLDEAHREAVDEALRSPPPEIVRAYQAVYGHEPRGWPPSV
jgi:TPP-dependent pyruvate/acetoin dehydrogenase alpha subunit